MNIGHNVMSKHNRMRGTVTNRSINPLSSSCLVRFTNSKEIWCESEDLLSLELKKRDFFQVLAMFFAFYVGACIVSFLFFGLPTLLLLLGVK